MTSSPSISITTSISADLLERPCRCQRLDVLADVVHAEDRRAALERQHGDGDARGHRARDRLRVAEHAPERALPRGADQDRPPERDDLVEPADELEVVLDRLAEADAGVEADALLGDAGATANESRSSRKADHLGDDVLVAGVVLHRARLAAHVHEAEVGAGVGDDPGQLGIAA